MARNWKMEKSSNEVMMKKIKSFPSLGNIICFDGNDDDSFFKASKQAMAAFWANKHVFMSKVISRAEKYNFSTSS